MAGVEAGTVYSAVRIRLTQLDQDLKGVYSRLDQLEGRIKGATDSTGPTKNFNLMALAGTAAFIAIGKAVKDSVGQFAAFEQSIANVASVSGGTAAEMQKLEDAARAAGETTRFTASQAADALYYLASAGLTASESVAALDGVLQLAGATQSDLAYTSAAVTATLSQFGLEASDAGRLSNVFAAAIGNSQANMNKLADAMRYAGPVAGAFGLSIEETTGALQVLFNAGYQGTQAGTILRNVFADLANSTGPVVTKLAELGVAFEDVDPTTNTFAESIRALQESGITAGEALAIFGDRAGPGLITLLQAGAEELEAYTADVTGTQAAAEAYATQNDTLAGSLDRLKSAAESLGISVGEGLSPLFRGLVDLLVDLIIFVNKVPGPIKAMAAAFAVGVLSVNAITAALSAMGIAANFALGPIGLLIGGVAALAVGMANVAERGRQLRVDELFGDVSDELEKAARNGDDLADAIKRMASETGLSVEQVIQLAEEHGLVTDEIRQQIELLREEAAANGEVAKSASEIADENAIIRSELNDAAKYMDDMRGWAKDYADRMGISLDRVVSLAQESGTLTDEQKEQLRILGEQVRLQEEQEAIAYDLSVSAERALQHQERRNELAERTADAAEREAEAEAERLRLEELQLRLEDEYLAARSEVLGILDSEKTEMDRIREQIDYLNAHPWAPGLLEEERLQALEILKAKLEELRIASLGIGDAFSGLGDDFEVATDTLLDQLERGKAAFDQQQQDEEDALNDLKTARQAAFDFTVETAVRTFSLLGSLAKANADKQIAELEREKLARLEAAGLAEETAVESAQAQYDAAVASGDAALIKETEDALAKAQIEEEYQRKIAKVQYEGQLASWKMQKASAIAQIPQAALNAYSSAAAVPLIGYILAPIAAAVATGFGLGQVAIVNKAKPQPPAFEFGGIVPGNSFSGDKVSTLQNSREMDITTEQQAALWDFIRNGSRGGGGGSQMMTVVQELSGRVLTETVVEYVDGGLVRFKSI